MGDPFPDVAATMIASDDFMGGDDGFAARCVTDDAATVMSIGGVDRHEREGAGECEERQDFFHGGFWIAQHSTMPAPPYSSR